MKWSLEKKWIASGFSLVLLLTGIASFISHQNANQLVESADKMKQTYTVLNSLTELFSVLIDAESGRRGYLLSGNKQELERHYQAVKTINPTIFQLHHWTANDPIQQQRLERLKLLITQRLYFAEKSIVLYQNKPEDRAAQSHLLAQNQKIRLEIRQIITQMKIHEKRQLQLWVRQSQGSIYYRQWIEIFSTFLSVGILLATFSLLYRLMIQRQELQVSQRILAQEKELSELKLRFFSLVSHEFRTPLSIILGSSQLLANSNQPWSENKRLKNIQRIQSSARLMTQLLTDILMLTRAEAGKLEINLDWIDLDVFCLNLIANLQLINENKNPIIFASNNPYSPIKLDEKLIHSILENLLSNAIKYSAPGKPIHLYLFGEPETIIFQVKDEGIGIPSESLSALYEPFYRAENAGRIVGTGLGLAVVKKCLELHQGEISVVSKEGIGTTFTVRIPHDKTII